MKLSGLSVLILISACIFYSHKPEFNLVVNGSFEQSKNGIMPDNWNGDNLVYSLSNESFSGKHSLKYSNHDTSVYKLCTQILNIQPGMNYTAGVKIKAENITGRDFGASFCVEWADEKGKWMGGNYPKGIKGTNDWTDINSVISIPDNAKTISFCCYVRKGMTGTAWFDDAFIEPYLNGKIKVMLLRPVYRGLLFDNKNQDIILSVNLRNIEISPEGLILTTVLYDSTDKEFIKDIKVLTTDKRDYIINLNPSVIPTGSYSLKVSLTDKNNSAIDSLSTLIRKIRSENAPAVYFDENKILVVNNKKVFPLGMYWGSISEDDLKIYSQSKFNFLLPYSQPTDEQMKLAAKYNMKVIYSVKDYYAGSQYVPAEIKSFADEKTILGKTVEHFRNHPSLLAWYNNDEYSPEFMDRLNEHYNYIVSEDPDHPVLSIIINPVQSELYLNSTDIIGSDPYVVPNLPLDKVGEATLTISRKVDNSRPVWMVIQAHNIGNYGEFIPNPQDYRAPTYDEMRSMSWQAICEGADGLIYYSYFDLKRNPDVPFEVQWSNLKRIAGEIDTFSNVLLSVEKTDSIRVNSSRGDNSWFDWTVRNYDEQFYIFVVTNGKNEGEITFTIPGKYTNVNQINGTMKRIELKDSEFTDTFRNLDLKIYQAE